MVEICNMTTNRIDTTFSRLKREKRAGFIAYITAGDPAPEFTVPLVLELERSGADIVELGVPFSDPLADGVVNQRASERALKQGVSLRMILDMVGEIRRSSAIPVVLFTYLNPVFSYGYRDFARDAQRAGVDGVLSLDLPPEEAEEYETILRTHGIASVFLIAPTTPEQRIKTIGQHTSGFVYYVSRTGVTGERKKLEDNLSRRIKLIKRLVTVPVAVGFGISTPYQVNKVAGMADAVVVGSAIVKEIESCGAKREVVKRVGNKVRTLTASLT